MTNADGFITSRHDYMPFGEEIAPTYPPPIHVKFTGQERDGETYQDYLHARYLKFEVGRFTTVDAVSFAPRALGDPQGYNTYAYAFNSPSRYVDPTGLEGESVVFRTEVVQYLPRLMGLTLPGGFDNAAELFSRLSIAEVLRELDMEGLAPQADGQADGSVTQAIKQRVCRALPQGRVTSLNGALGLVGGQQGAAQQVVNYNNGEVSYFLTGGLQFGWNGGASASLSTGFIYRQGQFSNSDFKGPFHNVSGNAPEGPGASVSWASNGVKVIQAGVGANLIPGPTGNYSHTWTSQPMSGGNIWINLANPLGLIDLAIYGARKAGGC